MKSHFSHLFSVHLISFQNVKAKAIYDNIAETVDELAFRKGEILDVIEQNTDGLDGWWLCMLRGRKGICPGNRLKVIDYETSCYTPSPLASPCSTSMSMSMSASTLTFSSQTSQPSELYENTSNKTIKGKRRSWHIMPNRVSIRFEKFTLLGNVEILRV
jgi:enhancer of filamentation 1